MENRREGNEAGKHRDMGIKTSEGQDNEGHVTHSKQTEFNERSAQEQERNDETDSNRTDSRGTVSGNETSVILNINTTNTVKKLIECLVHHV